MAAFAKYRHHKSGELYRFVCVANRESAKPNFPEMAVYQNIESSEMYARPLAEFLEKFEKV